MRHQWTRSRDELLASLQTQLHAISISCQSYDQGNKWEAVRLATAIKTLVHDGGRTRSILTQLKIRESLRYVSSGHMQFEHEGGVTTPAHLLLAVATIGDTAEWRPLMADSALAKRVRALTLQTEFETWWSREEIYRSGSHFLNRRRLVGTLRDQEGGAHLDKTVTDPAYVKLSRDVTDALHVINPDDPSISEPIMGQHLAIMRQIAWEMQQTLTLETIAAALP